MGFKLCLINDLWWRRKKKGRKNSPKTNQDRDLGCEIIEFLLVWPQRTFILGKRKFFSPGRALLDRQGLCSNLVQRRSQSYIELNEILGNI